MNRLEFIKDLFTFFKGTLDESVVRMYDSVLTVPYQVDWDLMLEYIVKKAEKRTLPMPKVLLDILPKFKIIPVGSVEEGIIQITYNDGRVYEFTKSWDGIDKEALNLDKAVKAVQYPPGTVFTNDNVFIDDEYINIKPVVLNIKGQ